MQQDPPRPHLSKKHFKKQWDYVPVPKYFQGAYRPVWDPRKLQYHWDKIVPLKDGESDGKGIDSDKLKINDQINKLRKFQYLEDSHSSDLFESLISQDDNDDSELSDLPQITSSEGMKSTSQSSKPPIVVVMKKKSNLLKRKRARELKTLGPKKSLHSWKVSTRNKRQSRRNAAAKPTFPFNTTSKEYFDPDNDLRPSEIEKQLKKLSFGDKVDLLANISKHLSMRKPIVMAVNESCTGSKGQPQDGGTARKMEPKSCQQKKSSNSRIPGSSKYMSCYSNDRCDKRIPVTCKMTHRNMPHLSSDQSNSTSSLKRNVRPNRNQKSPSKQNISRRNEGLDNNNSCKHIPLPRNDDRVSYDSHYTYTNCRPPIFDKCPQEKRRCEKKPWDSSVAVSTHRSNSGSSSHQRMKSGKPYCNTASKQYTHQSRCYRKNDTRSNDSSCNTLGRSPHVSDKSLKNSCKAKHNNTSSSALPCSFSKDVVSSKCIKQEKKDTRCLQGNTSSNNNNAANSTDRCNRQLKECPSRNTSGRSRPASKTTSNTQANKVKNQPSDDFVHSNDEQQTEVSRTISSSNISSKERVLPEPPVTRQPSGNIRKQNSSASEHSKSNSRRLEFSGSEVSKSDSHQSFSCCDDLKQKESESRPRIDLTLKPTKQSKHKHRPRSARSDVDLSSRESDESYVLVSIDGRHCSIQPCTSTPLRFSSSGRKINLTSLPKQPRSAKGKHDQSNKVLPISFRKKGEGCFPPVLLRQACVEKCSWKSLPTNSATQTPLSRSCSRQVIFPGCSDHNFFLRQRETATQTSRGGECPRLAEALTVSTQTAGSKRRGRKKKKQGKFKHKQQRLGKSVPSKLRITPSTGVMSKRRRKKSKGKRLHSPSSCDSRPSSSMSVTSKTNVCSSESSRPCPRDPNFINVPCKRYASPRDRNTTLKSSLKDSSRFCLATNDKCNTQTQTVKCQRSYPSLASRSGDAVNVPMIASLSFRSIDRMSRELLCSPSDIYRSMPQCRPDASCRRSLYQSQSSIPRTPPRYPSWENYYENSPCRRRKWPDTESLGCASNHSLARESCTDTYATLMTKDLQRSGNTNCRRTIIKSEYPHNERRNVTSPRKHRPRSRQRDVADQKVSKPRWRS